MHAAADGLTLLNSSTLGAGTLSPIRSVVLPAGAHATDWTGLLLTFWATGAVLFLLWQLACYYRFLGSAQAGAREFTRAKGISVLLSTTVPGACSTGLIRRRIFLPADLTQGFTREQVRLVLAHETAHHVRGDIWANSAALMIVAIHWFNPVAHLAYHAFRTDQELACDETVLAHEPEQALHPYGLALVQAATTAPHSAACLLGSVDQVKTRLSQMSRPLASLRTRALGIFGSLSAAVAGAIFTASTYAAAPLAAAQALPSPLPLAAASLDGDSGSPVRPLPRIAPRSAAPRTVSALPAPLVTPQRQVDPGVDAMLASGREALRAACGIRTRIESIDAPGIDIGPRSGLSYRCQTPDAMRAVSRQLQDDGISRIAALKLSSLDAARAEAQLQSGFTRIERDFSPDATS